MKGTYCVKREHLKLKIALKICTYKGKCGHQSKALLGILSPSIYMAHCP